MSHSVWHMVGPQSIFVLLNGNKIGNKLECAMQYLLSFCFSGWCLDPLLQCAFLNFEKFNGDTLLLLQSGKIKVFLLLN